MDEALYVEKYRPTKVADVILPDRLKDHFQSFVDAGTIPNLLLSGTHGVGKTSVAKAMVDEIGSSYMFINGSLDASKGSLRTDIKEFATSMSFSGGRKYVILDEADHLTHQVQPALRTFMEEYSSNAGFILTCNHPSMIIPELHSRCSMIKFKLNKEDKKDMQRLMLMNAIAILKKEGVEYDPKVVAELIIKKFPDFRKVLNELQSASARGKIDTGIFVTMSDTMLKPLFDAIKSKNFGQIRDWVFENDLDEDSIYRAIFDACENKLTNKSLPLVTLVISEYMREAGRVADPDIHHLAMLTQIAIEAEFK